MRLIDAEALKKDFEERYKACDEWIEKAKDEEIKIRADATKHFICEVIMTIDNAPTVESDYEWGYSEGVHDTERPRAKWEQDEDDNSLTCTGCGCHLWANDIINGEAYFCPHCGADMRQEGKNEV